MAIYIKCPSCGKEYNELVENKCPHCGCERPISEGNETTRNSKSEQEINNIPFTLEVPSFFSGIYNTFFNDGKLSVNRLLIISTIEAVVGIVIMLLGYFLALGTGTEKGPGMLMLAGGVVFMHAFYSLTKHSILLVLEKKNIQKPEKWTRYLLFSIEFVLGVIIIAIGVWLDDVFEHPGSNTWLLYVLLIGAGLVVGSICSLIKYYRNR